MLRWRIAWNKIPANEYHEVAEELKISVIIPVRNEAANIVYVLRSVAAQNYPLHLFEIIISDDQSDDETVSLVKNFITGNPQINIRVIEAGSKNFSSKKSAIKKAVDHTNGSLVVTTDADCLHHKDWLITVANYFKQKNAVMICGPVLLKGEKNFLHQFQQAEYTSMQICGAAALHLQQPLLCSGANLAFGKEYFYKVNGYDDDLIHSSGDDTFLMLKMHKQFPGRIHFLKSSKAIVTTPAVADFKTFLRQRARWISKTKFYSGAFIPFTGLFISVTNLLFPLLVLSSLFFHLSIVIAIACLMIKTGSDLLIISEGKKFFQMRVSKFSFVMMEAIYPVYLLILATQFFTKHTEWKKRKQQV